MFSIIFDNEQLIEWSEIKPISIKFAVLLILVSLRADDLVLEYFGSESMRAYVIEKYEKQRGNPPTFLEYGILLYVLGKMVNNDDYFYNNL